MAPPGGDGLQGPQYVARARALQTFARAIVGSGTSYDIVLTPAWPSGPCATARSTRAARTPPYEFKKSGEFTPYTAPFNVTGQPAISVPLYHGDDGLPLAVQLIGPPLGEGTPAAVCRQLEEAQPVGRPRAAEPAS